MVIILDHLTDLEDAELFDDGNNDVVNLCYPEDMLFSCKDLLDEIFVVVALSRCSSA